MDQFGRVFSIPFFSFLVACLLCGAARANGVFAGRGVAVADTKQLACAAALTYARREALELAGVSIRAVTSIRDVMTDDDTTSRFEAKIDQVASGLVKTVEKKLESSYDEESGAIRCLVNARFEVEKSKLPNS